MQEDTSKLIKALKAVTTSSSPDMSSHDLEVALKRFIREYIEDEARRGGSWLREVIAKVLNPGTITR